MDYVIEVSRRERKRQAIHESLLTAAGQLFREQGISGTTVDDIVGAVDVARQTFFNHFPYKEALAIELGAQGIQRVAERAHAMLENGCPAIDVLQRTAEWLLDAAIDDGELAVVVAQELRHPDTGRAARAAEKFPLCTIFEALLQQAREEGSVRDNLPLDTVAARLSDMVIGIMAAVAAVAAEKLRAELEVCFDIVFNGITG